MNAATSLARFAEEIGAERQRQLDKWGDPHHPDGTSGHNYRREADAARRASRRVLDRDTVTWAHILREEFWEAMAETDTVKLRAELIQVAAVCAAWVEDIDGRIAKKGGV